MRHPSGVVMAANGCVALRVSRGPVVFDDGVAEAGAEFVERVDALPWGRLADDGMRIRPPVWRGLDGVRGELYACGVEELWKEGRMTLAKPVWVGGAMMVPLAVLQLIARLPRVELRLDGAGDFLLIRFAGGEGMVANRWRRARGAEVPAHVGSLFTPEVACLPGGLVA
ncbi:hypothetical protein [Luteolibacter soli]|uniref:Uncharacterized protein n=1 Tax=Luteolibacter soli TaxID=3135280 RepID=A0ABU9AVD7_9BACT